MQVSVEKTSELNRKMTVNIPEEVLQEKMTERLKTLARDVKLDGFRPGKVPQHVVKRMYGERVKGEISGDLIQSTYFEALQEKSLRPAGSPHMHPTEKKPAAEVVMMMRPSRINCGDSSLLERKVTCSTLMPSGNMRKMSDCGRLSRLELPPWRDEAKTIHWPSADSM